MVKIFAMVVIVIALVAFLPAINAVNQSSPPAEISWIDGQITESQTDVGLLNAYIIDSPGNPVTITLTNCTGFVQVIFQDLGSSLIIIGANYLAIGDTDYTFSQINQDNAGLNFELVPILAG